MGFFYLSGPVYDLVLDRAADAISEFLMHSYRANLHLQLGLSVTAPPANFSHLAP